MEGASKSSNQRRHRSIEPGEMPETHSKPKTVTSNHTKTPVSNLKGPKGFPIRSKVRNNRNSLDDQLSRQK